MAKGKAILDPGVKRYLDAYYVLFSVPEGTAMAEFETRADAQEWVRSSSRFEAETRRGWYELRKVYKPVSLDTWLDGPPMDK